MSVLTSNLSGAEDRCPAGIEDGLLLRIAQGKREAFSALYRLAARPVYAYALSVLKNPQDAEDVLQDTFLKIRSAAGTYVPHGKPMAWIMTITRNLCLMKFRRQKRLSVYPLEETRREVDFSLIENVEDRIVVQTALKILSEEECQIIVLHAVTGWKHREIAGLLDLPLSTVLSKYRRGLKKLKSELEGKL